MPPAGCQLEQARAVLRLDLDRGAHAWIIHARACRWQQAWIHDCQAQEIQFTRGRPYQKDDNVHIEQKNWTHVRKLLGYVRDDTTVAQAAIHALYDRGRHRPAGSEPLPTLPGRDALSPRGVAGLYAYRLNFVNPRTDDAAVRANVVGIAPQVSGPIVELHVVDNQPVKQGDLLFALDCRPYEVRLARASADLTLTRKEVEARRRAIAAATSEIARREANVAPLPRSRAGKRSCR